MVHPEEDLAALRPSIPIGNRGVEDVESFYNSMTPEDKGLVADECDIIYECRNCRNLFRSLINFLSHKRSHCRFLFGATKASARASLVAEVNGGTSSDSNSWSIVVDEASEGGKLQRGTKLLLRRTNVIGVPNERARSIAIPPSDFDREEKKDVNSGPIIRTRQHSKRESAVSLGGDSNQRFDANIDSDGREETKDEGRKYSLRTRQPSKRQSTISFGQKEGHEGGECAKLRRSSRRRHAPVRFASELFPSDTKSKRASYTKANVSEMTDEEEDEEQQPVCLRRSVRVKNRTRSDSATQSNFSADSYRSSRVVNSVPASLTTTETVKSEPAVPSVDGLCSTLPHFDFQNAGLSDNFTNLVSSAAVICAQRPLVSTGGAVDACKNLVAGQMECSFREESQIPDERFDEPALTHDSPQCSQFATGLAHEMADAQVKASAASSSAREGNLPNTNESDDRKARAEDLSKIPVYLTAKQRSVFFSLMRATSADQFGKQMCVHCGAKTSTVVKSNRHALSHLGVVRMYCSLCDCGAFYIVSMRQHLRTRQCEKLHLAPEGFVAPGEVVPCMTKSQADRLITIADQRVPGSAVRTRRMIVSYRSLTPYYPDVAVEDLMPSDNSESRAAVSR